MLPAGATITKTERHALLGLGALLVFSLFYNLGVNPLFLEEPRRALIALELLYNDNLLVPTQFGEYYYRKPPVFNWVIIGAYQLFGGPSEFAVRFFTPLSFLLTGGLVFGLGRRYVSTRYGIYAALFLLTGGELYYTFSMLGEIDLFFSLLTFGSFAALFHYYRQGQYWPMYLLFYGLNALGTLTKGLPSVAFTGITVLVYFSYVRDIKKWWHPAHFAGMALYGFIVGGYFYLYSQYNSLDAYFETLFNESNDRTVAQNGALAFVQHFATYPLMTVANTLPGGLLLLYALKKGTLKQIKSQPLLGFALVVLAGNFALYWLSPGARSRYIYMLFPFIAMLGVYFYLQAKDQPNWRHMAMQVLIVIIHVAVIGGGAALPFIKLFKAVPNIHLVAVLTALAGVASLVVYLRYRHYRLLTLLFCCIVLRLAFNASVQPQRALASQAAQDKRDAAAIAQLAQGKPLYLYKNSRPSRSTIFYIEKQRGQVLRYHPGTDGQALYIATEQLVKGTPQQVLYQFQYRGTPYVLVQLPAPNQNK